MQDVETQRSLLQTEEGEHIKDYNERLEARQEVLEDHNCRLEDQLAKLRVLIQQVESAICNKRPTHKKVHHKRNKHQRNSTTFAGSEV